MFSVIIIIIIIIIIVVIIIIIITIIIIIGRVSFVFELSCSGSSHCREHWFLFLGKTLYSLSAPLQNRSING